MEEWLRKYSDEIWNQNGKHTHNDLDDILQEVVTEATRRGKHEAAALILEEMEKLEGD